MSQHLNTAIESISHEIERLTDLREQLSRMNDESGSALSTSSLVAKSSSKKSVERKTASKRSGRPPVSEETRQKMANARTAFFANKTVGGARKRPRQKLRPRSQQVRVSCQKEDRPGSVRSSNLELSTQVEVEGPVVGLTDS